jgi:hypothetical protein
VLRQTDRLSKLVMALESRPVRQRQVRQQGAASLAWISRVCRSRQRRRQLGVAKERRELVLVFWASLRPECQHQRERRRDHSVQGPEYRRHGRPRERCRLAPVWPAESQVPLRMDHLPQELQELERRELGPLVPE